jgi:hypothetical protein
MLADPGSARDSHDVAPQWFLVGAAFNDILTM